MENTRRLLRLPQVKALTGLSRSGIYQRRKDGKFPLQVALGVRAVAWFEDEIQTWITTREIKPPPIKKSAP
jgi:prophage regulatory protein